MNAIAIIGANFGDCGKGLMVDMLSQQPGTVVVRHNGGCNAGHTVVTPDGRRHVFHHFGAGVFNDASTFLSSFFVVNPFLWAKEATELDAFKIQPRVYVHPKAPVTTPYDMLINQEVERQRNAQRHGSCGLGVNETITRCQGGMPITVEKLADEKWMKSALETIRSKYVPDRLAKLKITPSDWFNKALASDQLVESYLSTTKKFVNAVQTLENHQLKQWDNVVFEGAQGLLLDEDHHFKPHITRSKTGLCNVMEIAKRAGIKMIEAVYVTRTYMTRHGAGLFPTEDPNLKFEDDTNNENEFQGAIRFGPLDFKLLGETIKNDLDKYGRYGVNPCLAVTHCDQTTDSETIVEKAEKATGLHALYSSTGPTRNDVLVRAKVPA